MPGWDIDPSGVRFVLSLVEYSIDGVKQDLASYGKNVGSAAISAGTISGAYCGNAPPSPIGIALTQFAERTASDAAFIGVRAVKSLNGAGAAAGFYLAGDLHMAADTLHKAAEAPSADEMPGGAGKQGGHQ
ncbi:DUF6507 family protein [Streptomyces gamaensis]|uniref:DUF6507 family protein n=1 Tax=Streptomyces gamaensis TaxID=1763542 RepID=A0ABW0ZCL0_9ACTN